MNNGFKRLMTTDPLHTVNSIGIHKGTFLNPGKDTLNQTWQHGTTHAVTWSSSFLDVHLTLWSAGSVGSTGQTEVFDSSGTDSA